MTAPPPMDRRQLVQTALTAAGALAIGFELPGCMHQRARTESDVPFAPNAWVRIPPAGKIVFVLDKVEMGQGTATALAMLLAEELEVALEQLEVQAAPADRAYVNPALGLQMTGGSKSVSASWRPLREAGAAVRELMVLAAATKWGLAPARCRAVRGAVYDPEGARSLTYGELIQIAATLAPPAAALKPPDAYRLIGKSQKRLDNRAKITGKAVYGIDVSVPGLRSAVILRAPTPGAAPERYDAKAALAHPGVEQVLRVSTGVAVVARKYWQARRAAAALAVAWSPGDDDPPDSAAMAKEYADAASTVLDKLEKGATPQGGKAIAAEYRLPFLAHAPMEPMVCTALVTDERCEIWAPTQSPGLAQQLAAEMTGLARASVVVHTTALGGGFGRRLCQDYVVEAVELAQRSGVPVKVIWSREDDIRHDWYRPASVHRLHATLTATGEPTSWAHGVAAQSILQQAGAGWMRTMMPAWLPEAVKAAAAAAATGMFVHLADDPTSVEGAKQLPYEIPTVDYGLARMPPRVPVGFWRSVGHSFTGFVVESFIDELAHAAGADPYAFRRGLLLPGRARDVLDLAAAKAGWSTPPPAGVGRGIAQHSSFDSHCAQVAEVSVAGGTVKVRRIVCAFDCGRVINPDGVEAQLQSAVAFGLSAALHGEITFKAGGVEQSNFHDYPPLRLDEMPAVEVHLASREDGPSGAGEPGLPPVAPAVANAVFALTGKRLRSLPLRLS